MQGKFTNLSLIWSVLCSSLQCRVSTYVWLLLCYPLLAVVHSLACVLSWLLVFTIPVAKMNARTLTTTLLMAPEDVQIHRLEKVHCDFLKCQSREIFQGKKNYEFSSFFCTGCTVHAFLYYQAFYSRSLLAVVWCNWSAPHDSTSCCSA